MILLTIDSSSHNREPVGNELGFCFGALTVIVVIFAAVQRFLHARQTKRFHEAYEQNAHDCEKECKVKLIDPPVVLIPPAELIFYPPKPTSPSKENQEN